VLEVGREGQLEKIEEVLHRAK